MKRFWTLALPLLLLAGGDARGRVGSVQVEIHQPAEDLLLDDTHTWIEVTGGASIFGGVRYLDLLFVIDTSKSLQRSDPRDYRSAGAVALVQALPPESDIRIGVVGFDDDAELLAPLTPDRAGVVQALRGLDRRGTTDLAEAIRVGLASFESGARPESSRVMLLFTDGKSDEDEALAATEQARARGVAIHTLLLGRSEKGAAILRAVADGTGGSFVRVTDPSRLPEAFLDLRTTGIDRVVLRVNDSEPIPTELVGGRFRGRVPLAIGENRITAEATSLAGETRATGVVVSVSGPLRVTIEDPVDGSVLAERRREAWVEGTASAFSDATPGILAEHPERGVARVLLSVNGSPPFATELSAGRFRGRVLLGEGENRIVATATALDGRTADDAVRLTMRPAGCGELRVEATRDGAPALSISDRAVEIVFDASNSMWARIGGSSKIAIARQILRDALDALPDDLRVALRVYGHRKPREERDCRDSELLVPFASDSRGRIREAIGAIRPRGQTPIGYSLQQIAGDFGSLRGERAVVLVTDGVESCGGDPVAAARALQSVSRVPVHVIGFGLGSGDDEDPASLRAIADVSGGRYLSARSAEELRDALRVTVGTAFEVRRDGRRVAGGTLGADDRIQLPGGDYRVRFESEPPYELPVSLTPEETLTLRLERERDTLFRATHSAPADYVACDAGDRGPTHAVAPEPIAPAAAAPVEPVEPLPEPSPAAPPGS